MKRRKSMRTNATKPTTKPTSAFPTAFNGPRSGRDFGRLLALNAFAARQMQRRRFFAWWAHLTPQERITTLAIVVGGHVIAFSSLVWAAAASYIAHQRVRMVKLEGIADEHVAAREAQMETTADTRDVLVSALNGQ
jgi:hypothetical protein